MSNQERDLLNKLLEEIGQLRGEMKSFKETSLERYRDLETRCEARQTNPETCTIGRSLKEHQRHHSQVTRGSHNIITLLLQAGMLAAVIITALSQ